MHSHTKRLHLARLARANAPLMPDATPELARAWHRMQLHWLHVYPGYRELIRMRISDVQRIRTEKPDGYCRHCLAELDWQDQRAGRRQFCSDACRKNHWDAYSRDHDELGRDVDGCG